MLGRNKGDTTQSTKMAFFEGNTGLSSRNRNKQTKNKSKNKEGLGPPHLTFKPSPPKTNKQKIKTNKEGLGPSEVALWATSPDLF